MVTCPTCLPSLVGRADGRVHLQSGESAETSRSPGRFLKSERQDAAQVPEVLSASSQRDLRGPVCMQF